MNQFEKIQKQYQKKYGFEFLCQEESPPHNNENCHCEYAWFLPAWKQYLRNDILGLVWKGTDALDNKGQKYSINWDIDEYKEEAK